jgi:hypothetical protein
MPRRYVPGDRKVFHCREILLYCRIGTPGYPHQGDYEGPEDPHVQGPAGPF